MPVRHMLMRMRTFSWNYLGKCPHIFPTRENILCHAARIHDNLQSDVLPLPVHVHVPRSPKS